MKSKFNMTVEQNITVAKRNVIDYIYKSANLEGIAVTFPETEDVYYNRNVGHLSVNDIVAINNLKRAWDFTLDNINYTTDYPFICKTNQIIGSNLFYNAGFARNMPVRMSGTDWVPDTPDENIIKDDIKNIMSMSEPTDRAITLMLYSMRKQIFIDGNKRTSMLVGNHIMIANGAGVISVPLEHQKQFRELLVAFYETNDMQKIKEFVYTFCIDGINFPEKSPKPAFDGTEQWVLPPELPQTKMSAELKSIIKEKAELAADAKRASEIARTTVTPTLNLPETPISQSQYDDFDI